MKQLLETHDAVVAARAARKPEDEQGKRKFLLTRMPSTEATEAVRVVGLRRQPDEPLVRIFIIVFI